LQKSVRDLFAKAALKDDKNCANQAIRSVETLTNDSDVKSAMKELKQFIGPFTVAASIRAGNDGASLEDEATDDLREMGILLLPTLKRLNWSYEFPDGQWMSNNRKEFHWKKFHSCGFQKKDVLDLLRYTIAKQKQMDGLKSKIKDKGVDEIFSATQMAPTTNAADKRVVTGSGGKTAKAQAMPAVSNEDASPSSGKLQ
jgi:hypothetical protein